MEEAKTHLKSIIRILVSVLIFMFLLRSLSYIMRTNGDTKDRFAGFYAEKKDTIDVLMIGSSTVGTSLCSPYMWHKYGFTSYPLSSNSQRPKAIKYLIEEGLKYQDPKLVIIELRTFIAEDEDMASDEGHIREVTDNMRYSIHRIKTINALADHFDDKMPFYIDIIKYHTNWGALVRPNEWLKFNYRKKNEVKGFEFKTRRELFRLETPKMYTEDRLPIPEDQEDVLRDLITYLKDKNLKALFVVTPRAGLEGYDAQMNYCSDIVTEAGFDFINLNYMYDEMDFDYRYDIDDGAHTNVWGALKCSDVVGRYIIDNYSLSDLYSKTTINDWDRSYECFEKKLREIEKEEEENSD